MVDNRAVFVIDFDDPNDVFLVRPDLYGVVPQEKMVRAVSLGQEITEHGEVACRT